MLVCLLVLQQMKNQIFILTDAKLYVPVITLSTQDNVKLLKHLESGFKRLTNWNKYQSKNTEEIRNQYLD